MKTLLLSTATAVLTALAVHAGEPATSPKSAADAKAKGPAPRRVPVTNEAQRAEIRAKILAYTGGSVQQVKESRRVVFLSLQEKIGKEALADVSEAVARLLRVESVLKSRTDGVSPMKAVAEELRDPKTGAVVLVCTSPDYPALLIAPESRWALVNVTPQATDKPSAETLAARVQREQWRALSYLAGAANTAVEKCPLKTVLAPGELDSLNKSPSLEAIQKMFVGLGKLGVHPARMTTYRKACEEGWAPAPTNDIQKAIWNEVKVGPRK
jgi:hypothetical protein